MFAAISATGAITSDGVGRTVCASLLGLPYKGEGLYNPSLRPAVAAGLVVAVAVYPMAFVTLLWRRRRQADVSAASVS
jgi:hypothetical protein